MFGYQPIIIEGAIAAPAGPFVLGGIVSDIKHRVLELGLGKPAHGFEGLSLNFTTI